MGAGRETEAGQDQRRTSVGMLDRQAPIIVLGQGLRCACTGCKETADSSSFQWSDEEFRQEESTMEVGRRMADSLRADVGLGGGHLSLKAVVVAPGHGRNGGVGPRQTLETNDAGQGSLLSAASKDSGDQAEVTVQYGVITAHVQHFHARTREINRFRNGETHECGSIGTWGRTCSNTRLHPNVNYHKTD
jgi:hypothetical protein